MDDCNLCVINTVNHRLNKTLLSLCLQFRFNFHFIFSKYKIPSTSNIYSAINNTLTSTHHFFFFLLLKTTEILLFVSVTKPLKVYFKRMLNIRYIPKWKNNNTDRPQKPHHLLLYTLDSYVYFIRYKSQNVIWCD